MDAPGCSVGRRGPTAKQSMSTASLPEPLPPCVSPPELHFVFTILGRGVKPDKATAHSFACTRLRASRTHSCESLLCSSEAGAHFSETELHLIALYTEAIEQSFFVPSSSPYRAG